ncbi:HEPN domain-containing protein [Chloroflexota bacterium]
MDYLSLTLSGFEDNLARVKNLLAIYSVIEREGWQKEGIEKTDILRSATIFLHATLEEFLRGIALWKWPDSDEEILNRVPLIGFDKYGQPQKFQLGKLAKHREKEVQRLITESVENYVNQWVNFSNTSQIDEHLKSVGVEVDEKIKEFYDDLDELIGRRHKIVHQADRKEGFGRYGTDSIELSDVERWVDVVGEFVSSVLDTFRPYVVKGRLF